MVTNTSLHAFTWQELTKISDVISKKPTIRVFGRQFSSDFHMGRSWVTVNMAGCHVQRDWKHRRSSREEDAYDMQTNSTIRKWAIAGLEAMIEFATGKFIRYHRWCREFRLHGNRASIPINPYLLNSKKHHYRWTRLLTNTTDVFVQRAPLKQRGFVSLPFGIITVLFEDSTVAITHISY